MRPGHGGPNRNRCGGQARTKMRRREHFEWEAEAELGIFPFVKSSKSWENVLVGTGRDSKVPNAPRARAREAGGVINTSTARRQFQWRPSASVSVAMCSAQP